MYQTSIRNKKKNKVLQNTKINEYNLDNDTEEYAYVIKMLGNCRVNLVTNSGNNTIGIIRGTLRKFNNRVLIEKGDIVVVSKRGFQDNKVDIVHKYNREQVTILISENKLSNTLQSYYANNTLFDTEQQNIEFTNKDTDGMFNNTELINQSSNTDSDSDSDSDLFINTNHNNNIE
tara:strand:+ start:219 stop:743 length:525 start_codon:yes stop_codon:yes gene_type:complete